MIWVLEGCDKTGKSSIAAELAKKLKCGIRAFGPPEGDPLEEYSSAIDSVRTEPNFVFDRFLVGEFVYPIVFDRPAKMTRSQFKKVELKMHDSGVVVVHVTASPSVTAKRFEENGEKLTSPGDIQLVTALYNLYFDHLSSLPNLRVDTTMSPSPASQAEKILQWGKI